MELQRTPFGLRMPEAVQAWIKARAKQEDRSQNYIINVILRRAMIEDEQKKAAEASDPLSDL